MGKSGRGRVGIILISLIATAALVALLWKLFYDSALVGANPQTTFDPASDNADRVHSLYILIFWLAGGVFAGVMVLTLAFSLMFRERPGGQALQTHGNSRLEILWSVIPVLIVVVMAVPTFQAIVETEGDAPEGALEVLAVGHQWWFEFQYPELGVTTANELHLPVDRPVNIRLQSEDVIHSFWAPRLMGKEDMVPGHENRLWFTPNEIGEYLGQCAEFCGLSHANMRFRVFVQSAGDFDTWAQAQVADAVAAPTPNPDVAPDPANPESMVAAGAQAFAINCAACHTVRGTGAAGQIGPDLTHVASRTTIASGTLPNTTEDLTAWVHDAPSVKPGSLMPSFASLSDEVVQQLVAYLQTLE